MLKKTADVAFSFRQKDIIEYRSEVSGVPRYAVIYSIDPSQGKFWINRGNDGGLMEIDISDLARKGVRRISPVDLINAIVTLKYTNLSLENKMETVRRALAV